MSRLPPSKFSNRTIVCRALLLSIWLHAFLLTALLHSSPYHAPASQATMSIVLLHTIDTSAVAALPSTTRLIDFSTPPPALTTPARMSNTAKTNEVRAEETANTAPQPASVNPSAAPHLANEAPSNTPQTASASAPYYIQPNYANNPPPIYPRLLREQGIEGVVWLRVWVDCDGHPQQINIIQASGYRLFDEAALRAVQHWRFSPTQQGDRHVASWVEFPIRFSLDS
ncbi:TonB family protein [Sapientia aquatica]|nr:energy transducer TonB [Sapientia aquatica]